MSLILSIAGMKGGSGKSSLAYGLYSVLKTEMSVAILDLDPQGSLLGLKESIANELNVHSVDALPGFRHMREDVVIVDHPPYLSKEIEDASIMDLSRACIIPLRPNFFDYHACTQTLNYMKVRFPQLPIFLVLNQSDPRSKISSNFRDFLKIEINSYNATLLNTEISSRVSYQRAIIQGISPSDIDPVASLELTTLITEILDNLKTTPSVETRV